MSGLDALLASIIADHRAGRHEAAEHTLLGRLLSARDEDGSAMSDRQLRDEAITVFLAGHETTALALTYAFFLLGTHPAAAARLHEELSALGGRPPQLDDLPRLPYTDAVVKESLRLYPPAWVVDREAVADVELAGHTLPKGTQLLASQWVTHRDPRWFEDAAAFRPERWLDGLEKRLPRFAFFPFGGGPRVCIGNHFAMMEAVLVLATVAARIDPQLPPDHRLDLSASVTMRPRHGLPVVVRRRG